MEAYKLAIERNDGRPICPTSCHLNLITFIIGSPFTDGFCEQVILYLLKISKHCNKALPASSLQRWTHLSVVRSRRGSVRREH